MFLASKTLVLRRGDDFPTADKTSISSGSEKRVNERRDDRTLAQHKQTAKNEKQGNQGYKPIFLACEQEFEKLSYNRHCFVLSLTLEVSSLKLFCQTSTRWTRRIACDPIGFCVGVAFEA